MSFNLNPQELQDLRNQPVSQISLFIADTLAHQGKRNVKELLENIFTMEFTGKKEVTAKMVNAVGGYPPGEIIPEKIQLGANACKINIDYRPQVKKLFLKDLARARENKREAEKVTSGVLARTF